MLRPGLILPVACLALLLALPACSSRDGAPAADASADAESDAGTDAPAPDASGDAPTADAGGDAGAGDGGARDAATADAGADDAGATDAATDADAGADAGTTVDAGAASDPLTYMLYPDYRRCAFPLCGGHWLRAVNLAQTPCLDGTVADRCYVSVVDWPAMGVTAERGSDLEANRGRLLVRGAQASVVLEGFGSAVPTLVPEAAWAAEWGDPLATDPVQPIFTVSALPLSCLVAPCFNRRLATVNVGTTQEVSGVDLSGTGATADQVSAGEAAATTGDLVVMGTVAADAEPGPGGLGTTLTASQFYLPVR